MIEKLLPLALKPGFFNNGTKYQAKGRWFRGSLVRFFEGAMRPLGGWDAITIGGTAIAGRPVAAVSYQKLDGTFVTVVGTTEGLYAIVYTTPFGMVSYAAADITPANLTAFIASSGPSDHFGWSLSVFGNYVIANMSFEESAETLTVANGADHLMVWDGDPTHVAAFPGTPPDTPIFTPGAFVTPEKFVVALGAQDQGGILTGAYPDPRLVWWASQATTDIWVPSDLNSAGSFSLASAGTLMAGTPFRGQSLLWTTRDLWSMQYIGQPLIYGFQQLGLECGLLSAHAYTVTSNAVFWMGQGRFYRFDGFVTPLQCDVADYVFSTMHPGYHWKTWALHNPQFNEVTWFYVSTAAAPIAPSSWTEVDSYVTYNYTENHWVFGKLSRSCGIPAMSPGLVPIMAAPNGTFFNHETGTVRSGAPTAFAESGPVELSPGDQIMRIQRIVPDDKTIGDVGLTLYASLFPDAAETSIGPVAAANPTSVRLAGRQVRLAVNEVNAVDWRVGEIRLGVIPSGRR